MAETEFGPGIKAIHGKIGNLLFREQWGKQTVCALPDYSGRTAPAKFLSQQEQMQAAARYWKDVKQDPVLLAAYQVRAKALNKTVFGRVYRDWCQPPSVQWIDLGHYTGQAGQRITVRVVDDFEVHEVHLSIRAAGGAVVETGLAVKEATSSHWWVYQTTAQIEPTEGVTVEAVAIDWPGNRDSRIQMLTGAAQ